MNLHDFVQKHCEGKQYDSCIESPCRFSSHSGCRHPMHPNNKEQEMVELKKDAENVSNLLFDYQREWINEPDFDYRGRVHNWRRYIPSTVKYM